MGTTTEIYDYLRLLYARVGKPHCYRCGRPIARQTVQDIVDSILTLPAATKATTKTAPKPAKKVVSVAKKAAPATNTVVDGGTFSNRWGNVQVEATFAPDGSLIARGAYCAEDLVVADLAAGTGPVASVPASREEELWGALRLGLADYVGKNGFPGVPKRCGMNTVNPASTTRSAKVTTSG